MHRCCESLSALRMLRLAWRVFLISARLTLGVMEVEEKKSGSLETRELFAECIRQQNDEGNIEALKTLFQESEGSEGDKRSILEQAFRDVLASIVSPEGRPPQVSECTSLVLLAVSAARAGVCYHTLPFIILSDVLECLTLDLCEVVFEFVEGHVSTWILPEFYSSGKNLLLRMSNDLLRRLSSAQNTIFCGRIQLFLARLFPLSEKSALNLMSHFNLENITTYNKEAGVGAMEDEGTGESVGDEGETMEVDDESPEEGSLPVDFNLYHKLWVLQDLFCQPSQCYSAEQWKVLTGNVDEVLRAFSSFKLEDVQVSKKRSHRKSSRVEYSESHYFAKFLTSEKLMNLQLRDSHFRRHILLQLLVLFHYLLGDVKFKSSSHSLQESQTVWVKETTERLYKLLEETPPLGAEFAEYVRHILKEEENWVAWKNDGCPSYEKPPLPQRAEQAPPYPAAEHLGDVCAKSGRHRHNLGNNELTRLWNLCPDNLEACRKKSRKFVPNLQKFIAEPVEQADPAARIEPEYKVINNPNFAWQALRLLSQSSPHFFQNTTAQIKSLPEYLEHVAVQTGKDLAKE